MRCLRRSLKQPVGEVCCEQCWHLKAERDGDLYTSRERCSGRARQPQASHRHRSLSHLRSLCSRPIARSLDSTAECRTRLENLCYSSSSPS